MNLVTFTTNVIPKVSSTGEIVLYSGENIRIHISRLITLPWVNYYPAKPTPQIHTSSGIQSPLSFAHLLKRRGLKVIKYDILVSHSSHMMTIISYDHYVGRMMKNTICNLCVYVP